MQEYDSPVQKMSESKYVAKLIQLYQKLTKTFPIRSAIEIAFSSVKTAVFRFTDSVCHIELQ